MSADIREADWKIFREIHPAALARFCDRVLLEVIELVNDVGKSSHERYRQLFKLLHKRDDDVANYFDDFRRSTAITQLAIMHARAMLTEEEFARFSPDLRERLDAMKEVFAPRKRSKRNRDE